MPLVLGIKYCGGCNVQFDRTSLVDRIREHFGDRLEIGYTSRGGDFDLILVLNACPAACASTTDLSPRLDMYVVRTPNDADPNGPVIPWIESYLENEER